MPAARLLALSWLGWRGKEGQLALLGRWMVRSKKGSFRSAVIFLVVDAYGAYVERWSRSLGGESKEGRALKKKNSEEEERIAMPVNGHRREHPRFIGYYMF